MVTLSSSTALHCDTRTASTGHEPRPPSENVSLRIVFRITDRFEPQRHRDTETQRHRDTEVTRRTFSVSLSLCG